MKDPQIWRQSNAQRHLEFADFVINPGQFPVIFSVIWLPAFFIFKKMQKGLLVIMANHGSRESISFTCRIFNIMSNFFFVINSSA
jgi:hypothetical protein